MRIFCSHVVYFFMEEAKQGSENETHDENTAPHPTIPLYQHFLVFFFFKVDVLCLEIPLSRFGAYFGNL